MKRGVENSGFKTGVDTGSNRGEGRFSRALPQKLKERYEAGLRDVELMQLRHEISILDVREQDLLRGLSGGGSPELWDIVKETFRAVRVAPDAEAMNLALVAHEKALNHGYAEEMAWRGYSKAVDDKAKVVKQEQKHMIDMRQLIPVEKMYALIAATMASLKNHVDDEDTLVAIGRDVELILDVKSSNYDGPGAGGKGTVSPQPLPARLPGVKPKKTGGA